MTDFQRIELGSIDEWRNHYGGFRPESSRDGRRIVDHELTMQYIGLSARCPGDEIPRRREIARCEASPSSDATT